MKTKRKKSSKYNQPLLKKEISLPRIGKGQIVMIVVALIALPFIAKGIVTGISEAAVKRQIEASLQPYKNVTNIPGFVDQHSIAGKTWHDTFSFENTRRHRYTSAVAYYNVKNFDPVMYEGIRQKIMATGNSKVLEDSYDEAVNINSKTSTADYQKMFEEVKELHSCFISYQNRVRICLSAFAEPQYDDIIGGELDYIKTIAGFNYKLSVDSLTADGRGVEIL